VKANRSIENRVAKLEELLKDGRSFAQAVNELVPPSPTHATLMRRASAVRVFDRAMFEAVIGSDLDIPFDDLIQTFGVERTHTSRETYRVVDTVAADHLESWIQEREGRDEVRRFTGAVFKYLRARSDTHPLELLRFRVPSDPQGGLEEFEKMFDQADREFDLAACHALVQMLRELDNFTVGLRSVPLKLLSDELRSQCNKLIPYIAARGRFIEEYTKSENYLQRTDLFDSANAFLQSKGSGMFPIYGAGGRGKTIFLRWLVSRHCVPRPNCIPVAQVDFDDINIAKLETFPWLILLRLAEQLNRQMEGAPLSEFLDRHVKFSPILLPAARQRGELRVDDFERELAESSSREETSGVPGIGTTAVREFAHKMVGPRVVLILDTLEEAVLHFPGSLTKVLKMFREVLQVGKEDGQVKLILSGRYDLKERGFLTEPDDPDPVEVGPFLDSEAGIYLREKRHTEAGLIPAIIAKAQGNPFALSLIADLVEQDDIRDVAGVEKLKPEFEYLIKRVIERIPDSQFPVRWVVRYGVVPQRLTREFLQHVMEEPLRREVEGSRDERRDEVRDYNKSFPRDGKVDVGSLWDALRGYADSSGWLRVVDAEELRFQPEVVQPMRVLLKQEPLYQELHEKAVRWFEAQARERDKDPRGWALSTSEAFFHRLQLSDAGLERWWHNQMAVPQAQEPAARRELLTVLTTLLPPGSEVPNGPDGLPLLSSELLGRAHLELAKLGAGLQLGPCLVAQDPSTIRKLLNDAREYLPPINLFARDFALVEMALAVNDREYDKVLDLAKGIDPARFFLPLWEGADLYAFHLLRARAFAGKNDPLAEDDFHAAWGEVGGAGELAWEVIGECIRELARIGQLARGLAVFREAISNDKEGAAPAAFMLEAAELFLEARDYEEARSLALSHGQEFLRVDWLSSPERFRAARVFVLCDIAMGKVLKASRLVSGMDGIDTNLLQSAQMKEIRGEHAAAAYNLDLAITLLQEAAQSYNAAGARAAAAHALLRAVRVMKELKGDWAAARMLIERSGLTIFDFMTIEHLHLLSLAGKEIGNIDVGSEWVAAAIRLLTSPERSLDRDFVRIILHHLEQIEPPSLRYEYLHFFLWLPVLKDVSDLEKEFRGLLPPPEPGEADFFPRVFVLIELYRCLGTPSARDFLAQAIQEVDDDDVFVYERLIDAARRLGASLPPVDDVLESCRRVMDHGLGAATLIRLQSVLIEREDPRAELVAKTFEDSLPESLQGTQFEVYHRINRSRLAAKNNNKGDAKNFARGAARLLMELGREVEGRRLLAQAEAGQLEESKEDKQRIMVPLNAVPNPFEFASGTSELVTFNDSLKLLDQQQVVNFMRQALPDGVKTKPMVELIVDDANLVSLPWEWAMMTDDQLYFRSIRTMPSANFNPLLRAFWTKLPVALRRFIGSIWPFRILILHPPVAQQERAGRGFDLTSRRTLAEIYRAHGSKTFEPPSLTTELIGNEFRAREAHVIHIQASVVESQGQLAIDLPLEDDGGSGTTMLDVDFWARQLRSMPARPPVVILDPPRPRTDVEVARQLLMRNRFAADLAAKGQAGAVICAGLFEPAAVELVAERLALEISGNPQLRQLLTLLHSMSGDQFCTGGAALFVKDPEALLK
jgi:hypothetical protein